MGPAIGFAHRGARAHERENTLEAFALALGLGATGLESDVWLTRDGAAVLDHDGVVRGPDGVRSIRELTRAELPDHVPSLAELYRACGSDFELSLDVKDPGAAAEVVRVARAARALERLWLCHPSWKVVAGWRSLAPEARLVDSTRVHQLDGGALRRAKLLRAAAIDAVNLHGSDWTPELVRVFQSAGLRAFAWDLQTDAHLQRVLAMGIDAVYSDHVDRMMTAIRHGTAASGRRDLA
jgi:glycerophosphoryl diester phosphodiesterase